MGRSHDLGQRDADRRAARGSESSVGQAFGAARSTEVARPELRPAPGGTACGPPIAFDFARIQIHDPANRAAVLRAKLVVGSSADPLEAEADRVATAVLRMPAGAEREARSDLAATASGATVRRSPSDDPTGAELPPISADTGSADPQTGAVAGDAGGDDDIPSPVVDAEAETEEADTRERTPVQRKHAGGDAPAAPPSLETQLGRSRGGGHPLAEPHRRYFEERFGFDFSRIRVHADADADSMNRVVNARAFTTGQDLYFRQGEYRPESTAGRHLLAHELTHVIQQSRGAHLLDAGAARPLRRDDGGAKKAIVFLRYQVLVPADYTTLDEMFRLFERTVYGKEMNFTWSCNAYCDMAQNRGKVVPFKLPQTDVEARTDPAVKKRREQSKTDYGGLPGGTKKAVSDETDRRYYKMSGDEPGTKIKKGEAGKSRMWELALDEVMKDREALEKLLPPIKELMTGKGGSFQPKDYEQLLRIAKKLEAFTPEDFTVYKLLAIRATDNLDLFERSVDMYVARKAELKKALDAQLAGGASDKKETLRDAFDEKWKSLDSAQIGTMSEADRYDLARQKTSELTAAQLEYMKDHPGETLGEFAKSATLMNTPETFGAIGKDLTEVANGDANSWARWAAGTGAGAKLSGWLLAFAGILYVASWLTGIGELATIAAAAGILLGSTLTLSLAESELRIKAASQAKTPEEFKRNVEAAAAARSNVIVGVALLVLAAVLHFTAKALFPKQLEAIKVSLKNLREKVRRVGSIHELKPAIATEMAGKKAALTASSELAKKSALDTAAELDGLSTEQFVDRLEKGDGGFLDQSKVPADQKINYRELLETPEGRTAIEGYKQRLVNALKTDVIAQIDRLTREYQSKIDEFLKDVDAAKNHDDMNAAAGKLEEGLSEENAKKFMKGEQDALTQKKLEEEGAAAQKEVLKSVLDGIVKRVKQRVGAQSDKFQLTYTEAELEAIFKKGTELGLSARLIEDLIYTGSRVAKAISAADLMVQMENWASIVSKRGYPFKFTDLAEFQQFSKDLLEAVKAAGLPTDDVRVQGSALRKPTADDVDLAVFVSESVFDNLLIDRFEGKAAFSDAAPTPRVKLPLKGKSHAELLQLAAEIAANESNYNAVSKTFMNAVKTGIINSKSDIFKPLKAAKAAIAEKYPGLNIQTISVLIKGGAFDVVPDMPIKGN